MEAVAIALGIGALLAVAGVIALYASRQRTLSERVGSFTCHLRAEPAAEAGWAPGVAQYGADKLVWWRAISLSPRPEQSWSRRTLTVVERVPLDEADHDGRPMLLVHCRNDTAEFSLTMSVSAFAGLVSWLESGPRHAVRGI